MKENNILSSTCSVSEPSEVKLSNYIHNIEHFSASRLFTFTGRCLSVKENNILSSTCSVSEPSEVKLSNYIHNIEHFSASRLFTGKELIQQDLLSHISAPYD